MARPPKNPCDGTAIRQLRLNRGDGKQGSLFLGKDKLNVEQRTYQYAESGCATRETISEIARYFNVEPSDLLLITVQFDAIESRCCEIGASLDDVRDQFGIAEHDKQSLNLTHEVADSLASYLRMPLGEITTRIRTTPDFHKTFTALNQRVSEVWVPLLAAPIANDADGYGFAYLAKSPSKVSTWVTAQALVAFLRAAASSQRPNICEAFEYLYKVRLPKAPAKSNKVTPGQGWGYFSNRTNAITEIGAWVCIAWGMSIRLNFWKKSAEIANAKSRLIHELECLWVRANENGSLLPTDTERRSENDVRTYSSVMALWAAVEGMLAIPELSNKWGARTKQTAHWLCRIYESESGWTACPYIGHKPAAPYHGLTAQVLYILTRIQRVGRDPRSPLNPLADYLNDNANLKLATRDFIKTASTLLSVLAYKDHNTPLSAHETLVDDEKINLEPSRFCWPQWSVAALANMEVLLNGSQSHLARDTKVRIASRILEFDTSSRTEDYVGSYGTFELAESIFCLAEALDI